jgi:deoxycytidylate deaminase
MERIVVGLTGAFGSGCTFLTENFFEKELCFKKYSLSLGLKEMFKEVEGRPHRNRHELQEFGNKIRKDNHSILAEKIFNVISENDKVPSDQCIVIDSIRNPYEVEYFRNKFPEFVLIAVFADYDIRWGRVKTEYHGSKDDFDEDEIKDQGTNEPLYGQKISTCFFESDVILSNNYPINPIEHNDRYTEMQNKISNYVKAFRNPTSSNPTIDETLMAMAYASGRRSRCRKRRVGAVIVDKHKNILSSGFNGVPKGLSDCVSKHGNCYRDSYREKLRLNITNLLPEGIEDKEAVSKKIISRIKALELCRALHAEENAIINLVGKSISTDLSEATLYATTYPCNLCANKIVQVGIKKVIYFEPYPVIQAKEIFEEAKVNAEPFEGVTFRAFFRAFNYED